MSETSLLTSVDEMLETAQLQLADIRFDHMSIDLWKTLPRLVAISKAMSRRRSRLNACSALATKANVSEPDLSSSLRLRSGRPLSRSLPTTRVSQEFALAPEVPADFASRVALMAAFPYVREALSDLTTRVTGTAVVLPLLRPGQITFAPNK